MAKNQNSQTETQDSEIIVSADSSTFSDKLSLIQNNSYNKRSRWGYSKKVFKLNNDIDYLRHIFRKKYLMCSYDETNTERQINIKSSIFKCEQDESLYALVMHVSNKTTVSLNTNVAINNKKASCFAVGLFNTNEIEDKDLGKNFLEVVDLFRYDAYQPFDHMSNDTSVFGGGEVERVYKKYFSNPVPTPHFHFCNKLLIEEIGKSASEVNAINIDHLLKYIDDLISDNRLLSVLNNYDFAMPYLAIKKNPKLYSTSYEVAREVKKVQSGKRTKKELNAIVEKVNNNLFTNEGKQIYGLEAVKADLLLLKILLLDSSGKSLSAQMKMAFKIGGFTNGATLTVMNENNNGVQHEY